MTKSMYDFIQEKLNHSAIHSDFPMGTKVEIITPMEDFQFFYNETGVVSSNTGKYLGITVVFDKPREFEDGYIQYQFNFNPSSLKVINQDQPNIDYDKLSIL